MMIKNSGIAPEHLELDTAWDFYITVRPKVSEPLTNGGSKRIAKVRSFFMPKISTMSGG